MSAKAKHVEQGQPTLTDISNANRAKTRAAVFGPALSNPNFQRTFEVLDGDKDYSSKDLGLKNQGS
jgi:hypothetical protein